VNCSILIAPAQLLKLFICSERGMYKPYRRPGLAAGFT
jgi:hypothetical protein